MSYKIPFPQPSLDWAAGDFEPPPPPLDALDEEIRELAEDLFEVIVNLDLMVPWLRQVVKVFGANGGQVALFDFQTGSILLHAFVSQNIELPPSLVLNYEDVAAIDERGGLAVAFSGRAIASSDFDQHKVKALPIVQITPDDVGQFLVVNHADDPYWSFLSVLKHKNAPKFSNHERARLAALGAVFQKAMDVLRLRLNAMRTGEEFVSILENMSTPMAMLAGDGQTMMSNLEAQHLIDARNCDVWTRPAVWGKVTSMLQRDTSAVVVSGNKSAAIHTRITRLTAAEPLFLAELDVNPSSDLLKIDRFCLEFRLTKAERQVLELLREGVSLKAIAELRQTSLETIRVQLRAIRSKSGLSSQAEILNEIMSLPEKNLIL